MLFKSHTESVTTCQQLSKDLKTCEKDVTVSRTSAVVSLVLSLLLQTCEWYPISYKSRALTFLADALIIVYQYGHRLEEKHDGARSFMLSSGPAYAQAPVNESFADHAPKAYAYSDPHNSYGHNHV
jgi:hypothetical protein